MKKIGVFLGVLFMGLLIFVRSPAPAHADAWVLPFSKIPDILEMAQTLFSGGKLEFSSIISAGTSLNDILEMWQDFKDRLAHAETQKRAKTTLSGMVDLTMQGVTAIAPGTDFVIPFTFDDVNAFTLYNPYWYLQNMTSDPDSIVISPDASFYQNLLDVINKRDNSTMSSFWFYDMPETTGSSSFYYSAVTFPFTSYSWFVADSNYNINANDIYSYYLRCSHLIDINITSSNGVYSYNYNANPISNTNFFHGYGDTYYDSFRFNYSNSTWEGNSYTSNNLTFSYSGSIGEVLSNIASKFRNVNIYVDGALWSWAGEILLPPVGAPDVIQVGDTGQDTYDVYGLELPDDLGLDIPDFIDWILTKLKEGATTISLEDAIADEVPLVRTVDGDRAITYSDTRPIWEVIEKNIDIPADDPDPNPSPTPTPDPGDPPILKLPTFNYLPHNHDSTVLAELIDATQNTIPDELMNLIWNCFGLLVIGGLIFILHK